jgi:uncharacterized protein
MDRNDDDDLFDRNDGNLDYLTNCDPEEVEEAVLDPKRIGTPAYNVGTERRWALLGATEAGAILFVIYTLREKRIRVVTVREATPEEQRRYRQRGK